MDLQLGAGEASKSGFELLANIYLFATDEGVLQPRGWNYWPKAREFESAATTGIARLKYKGNYDPEPLAWRRLAIHMGNRYRIKLDVTSPLPIAELDARSHPVAAMTGTDAFSLDEQETGSLKKYFREGGTLIVDAAGGSRKFDQAVERQILTLPDDAEIGPIAAKHTIYAGPEVVDKVTYRRGFALALGPARNAPRLIAVKSGNRLAIIYSREDLTAGLMGYQLHGIRGYSPQSASALMTNIVCYAAGKSAEVTTQSDAAPADAASPTTSRPDQQDRAGGP